MLRSLTKANNHQLYSHFIKNSYDKELRLWKKSDLKENWIKDFHFLLQNDLNIDRQSQTLQKRYKISFLRGYEVKLMKGWRLRMSIMMIQTTLVIQEALVIRWFAIRGFEYSRIAFSNQKILFEDFSLIVRGFWSKLP